MTLQRNASTFFLTPGPTPRSCTMPPEWVGQLVGSSIEEITGQSNIIESSEFCLASVRVQAADLMDGPALEHAAAEVYQTIRSGMEQATQWHPLRFWNFLPGILADGGAGMDRYMRFNAGRYRAFTEWFGGAGGFDRSLPTASAVGYDGTELVVHALGARVPGESVANPRQVSPHYYSRRFGPLPPCFARATRVRRANAQDLLLVGGTSSVRGEDSVHVGDVRLQLAETVENLAALVREAFGACDQPLAHFRAIRIYHARASDLAALQTELCAYFPCMTKLQWQQAELCRGDLLVEVEGLASFG